MTPSESPRRFSQALRGRNLAVIGAGVALAFIALLAFVGPWLVLRVHGFGYTTQELANTLAGPSWTHPLGTDVLGRDVFVRLLHGTRISLLVGILATAIAFLIGVAYGSVAGYAGGRIDEAMMRTVDVLYALPTLLLIVIPLLFKRVYCPPPALGGILVNDGAIMGGDLRVARVLWRPRERGSTPGIIARHVVPNAVGPMVKYHADRPIGDPGGRFSVFSVWAFPT